jgi:hypothetical protein
MLKSRAHIFFNRHDAYEYNSKTLGSTIHYVQLFRKKTILTSCKMNSLSSKRAARTQTFFASIEIYKHWAARHRQKRALKKPFETLSFCGRRTFWSVDGLMGRRLWLLSFLLLGARSAEVFIVHYRAARQWAACWESTHISVAQCKRRRPYCDAVNN